ncbi:MAG TPA: DUF1572 family protein [Ferruginibacter sp.]|nr:DUF1572 family protein [Ferruginibacter sp.]
MSIGNAFLQSAISRLTSYKELADKTFAQLSEKDFFYQPNEQSNSIAIIIQHMAGNMLSRWTDFLTTDGEKPWRNRDVEFNVRLNYQQLLDIWEKGWNCCLQAIANLTEDDLTKTIYIRGEALLAIDAINRQLTHYPCHVGQIIYIAKILKNESWQTLSIAKGKSTSFKEQAQSN